MAEDLPSLSLLPWIWSIETLASAKEVDESFIHDIIEIAPRLPDDLGKNMTETVALRCLEGLHGSSNGSTNKVSIAMDSKIGFHPSESCQSVLRFISGKTPSNLTVTGAEQLKMDIQSFIMHKRDSMAKCTLQQLKDAILEGVHKYVDTLKDISGLTCINKSETMPSGDVHRSVLPQMHILTQSNEEKGNSVCQSLEDRVELGTKKVGGDISESQYVLKAAKKRKHCDSSAITSEDEPCQNFTGSEIEKNSTCPAEPQTLSATPQEGTHHKLHESSGTQNLSFQTRTPNNASHDESQEKVITNEPKHNMDDYGNEKIDVAMTKNPFLRYQFTLGCGSSAMADRTERNFCVKCNEGGELLVCKSLGCYMVIHEDCLGVSARFDNEGNFCCPFCTYSVAISEYLEAKKTASLARKRLSAFMGPNFERRSDELAEGLQKEGCSKQGEDEDLEVRNGHLGETGGNQARDRTNEVNHDHV